MGRQPQAEKNKEGNGGIGLLGELKAAGLSDQTS